MYVTFFHVLDHPTESAILANDRLSTSSSHVSLLIDDENSYSDYNKSNSTSRKLPSVTEPLLGKQEEDEDDTVELPLVGGGDESHLDRFLRVNRMVMAYSLPLGLVYFF